MQDKSSAKVGKNAVKGREYFDTNGIIVLFLQQIITEGSEEEEEWGGVKE